MKRLIIFIILILLIFIACYKKENVKDKKENNTFIYSESVTEFLNNETLQFDYFEDGKYLKFPGSKIWLIKECYDVFTLFGDSNYYIAKKIADNKFIVYVKVNENSLHELILIKVIDNNIIYMESYIPEYTILNNDFECKIILNDPFYLQYINSVLIEFEENDLRFLKVKGSHWLIKNANCKNIKVLGFLYAGKNMEKRFFYK